MAKYTVTCEKCGTEITLQLVGKLEQREWILNHGTHICEKCKAEENAAVAAENAAAGFPQLQGSEKQIAWAEKIRKEKASLIKDIKFKPEWDANKVITVIMQCRTQAAWWIDHRHATGKDLVIANAEEIRASK